MLGKRRLGRTGISVSMLGFGGIPIMRVTQDEATAVIKRALERGIDFFDTARGYGDSEKKIGTALATHAAKVVLASKSPKRTREEMLEDFNQSLSDLGIDVIDLYQVHCVNKADELATVMAPGGALEALEELRSEGRVRFVGITSHNLGILKQAIGTNRFDTIQVLYSFVEDGAGKEVIPLALEKDLGVIAMKPLGGGCIEQCDVAIRYVLSTPGVIAIPGMAAVDEVDRNVEAASDLRPLTAAELDDAERTRTELGKTFCRRCDYCQPCPKDIPIALMLHIDSIRKRVGETFMRNEEYRDVLDKANGCDECGQCEERCPFDLPVRDLIKESRDALRQVLK
ncbi:MAG: aldo/keto reductase [Candidatus Eisenbacteria bacterium]